MNNKLIVIQQLATNVGAVDQMLSARIEEIPNSESMSMPQWAKQANAIMREHLTGLTNDADLIRKGCHPLSTPENWDAVCYWLTDINLQYVPALRRAKAIQNESSTCA